jgi:hypothetical protein
VVFINYISGVVNKGGTVLLALDKPSNVWSCPSFPFSKEQNPIKVLQQGMKDSLNLNILTEGIIYRRQNEKVLEVFVDIKKFSGPLENKFFTNVGWFDVENLKTIDVKPSSKIAIYRSELMSKPEWI